MRMGTQQQRKFLSDGTRLNHIFCSAICTTSLTEARDIEIERRVVHGRTMARGEWPFLVSLHYLKPFPFTEQSHMKHICGGALIHPQWVLTAAHCMGLFASMGTTGDWEIVLGEHNQFALDKGEQVAKVESFHVHPGFQPNKTSLLSNDIALVKLSEPAKMSQYVSIMGLNDVKELDENLHCQIGGWGQIQSEPYGWGMYIPLKTRVYIVDNEKCAPEYKGLALKDNAKLHIVVDNSIVCAGGVRKSDRSDGLVPDACMGDSGSPLICRTGEEGEYQITGVVSAGEGCGNPRFAGIYTRVSTFQTWIEQVIEDNH